MFQFDFWFLRKTKAQRFHHRKSIRLLKKIRGQGDNPALIFGILRNTNPYTFEELILTAFRNGGFKIRRSKGYSGDGGIDGQVRINGRWYYIQSKRYKSAINPSHVAAFAKLLGARRSGLFVHCGRTGKKSWQNTNKHMTVVSGSMLIELLVSGMIIID